MHFMAVKMSRKRSGFVLYSYIKDSAFTELKRDANFYTRYVKGVPFEEGIRKMSLSCQISYIKGA